MKALENGWLILMIVALVMSCARREEPPQTAQASPEETMADEAAGAEATDAEAAGEEGSMTDDATSESAGEMTASETTRNGEESAREEAPPTPVVIYFKEDPSEADLEWLRDVGFVVSEVAGKVVSGRFQYNPPPEFQDDPRLDRVVPLQRPPGPN